MPALVLLRNPLTPHTREIFPLATGSTVIDWLQAEHPKGFGMPVRFFVNGAEKPLDDLDYAVAENDVAVIALMPALPISLSALAINLAISIAISGVAFGLNYLFAPKADQGKQGKQVSIFDVSTEQNAAKIGEPIPVVYGSVLTTPDYVAQPYSFFSWSQSSLNSQLYNGVQYLDLLMCVGHGDIDVDDVFVGDTNADQIDASDGAVVTWRAFRPSQHLSDMGVIAAAMGGSFHENVISSAEVGNQEFLTTDDTSGPFTIGKPGQAGTKLQIDIIFPGGQFNPDSSGDVQGRTTEFDVTYQEVNDSDVLTGSATTVRIKTSTGPNNSVTGPNMTSVTTSSASPKNRSELTVPIRRTYTITTPRSARWAVKIRRVDPAPNSSNGTDRFIWAGLKMFADYPAGDVYGNVTLLAARIKASQGLGSNASVRIRCKATRRLASPTGGAVVASTSAADAFADVYVDDTYGAARPRTELDTATLTTLRTEWAAYEFNHVFRSAGTVWEALRTITTPFAAEPLPLGALMSVAQDGVKTIRSALFTDANIVAGSLTIAYSFDEEGAADGVEIEYLDPKDFRESYVVWPSNALRPNRFALPGVTDATHAAEYARLTWQRTQLQRKRVTFDTELEGLILQMGDRIGVAHNVPRWGDSGLVIAADGTTLTVDHDLDWSGGTKQILLRKPDGSVTDPITVSRGTRDNKVVLPSSPPTTINYDNDNEYTSFAFGSSTTLVRDFVVVATRPTGENTVTVEAVNYDAAIFTGAMSYMD
jgi:hypothetical protein